MKVFRKIIDNENTTLKGYLIRVLISIAVGILFAVGVEVLISRDVIALDASQQKKQPVSFSLEENVLKIEIPKQYVQYLRYEFSCPTSLVGDLLVHVPDDKRSKQWEKRRDANHLFLEESICRVDRITDHIEIHFDENQEFTIHKVWIDNQFIINWRRAMAVFVVGCVMASLILCIRFFVNHIEVAFVLLALGIGLVFLCASPITKSVWDEGIHFKLAYTTSIEKQVGASDMLCTMMDDHIMSEVNPPQTYLEYKQLEELVDLNYDTDIGKPGVQTFSRLKMSPRNIGYIFSGLVFSLGRIFHLKFSHIYMLGKIMNLLVYIALVYIALKKKSAGTKLIFTVALMPTPMYIATSLNRDAILNGCAFVGIAYFLFFVSEQEKVKMRDYFVAMLAFVTICAMKPVYAPLLLLLLLVPSRDFQSKKLRKWMWFLVLVVGVGIILSFVIPAINPNVDFSDARGGDTSGNKQLHYILSAPMVFVVDFFRSVCGNFTEYLLGCQVLGNIGAYGLITEKYALSILLFFVGITGADGYYLTKKEKKWIAVADCLTIFFIWFCMYLAFSPVGATYVSGVQGRYFIPLIVPVLILFNSDKIQVNISKNRYHVCLYMGVAAIVFQQMFHNIILKYIV